MFKICWPVFLENYIQTSIIHNKYSLQYLQVNLIETVN